MLRISGLLCCLVVFSIQCDASLRCRLLDATEHNQPVATMDESDPTKAPINCVIEGRKSQPTYFNRGNLMQELRFVASLTTSDNDYQMEQASAAEEAANRLNIELEILYAENDAILQSQQLLKIIQSNSGAHPDGIIFEPVGGTALPKVATAAAATGIGWVVLNREVDYISELRRAYKVPIFTVTSDHEEIGRLQGKQLAALLPNGGSVLLIQGPSESLAAKQRTTGMYETKPVGIQIKLMKGNWTEVSAYKVVSSWLKLSTSQQTSIDVIAAQNDAMALGARKAFQELGDSAARDRFLAVPYLGIDGVPTTGQAWVRRGLLNATIVVPANTGQAIALLAHAVKSGTLPPEKTLTVPRSLPIVEELARKPVQNARGGPTSRPQKTAGGSSSPGEAY
jgi:ABC-type sugar transport system substrate-binding protein